ncbi:hypothetical protein PFISCL1PPCAC_11416, partial [Pristionchus fissidentatus]
DLSSSVPGRQQLTMSCLKGIVDESDSSVSLPFDNDTEMVRALNMAFSEVETKEVMGERIASLKEAEQEEYPEMNDLQPYVEAAIG